MRRDLVCGATDVPLDPTGLMQAEAVAERLRAAPPGSIWTSPLSRAHETARIVAAATGAPLTIVPNLGERDWGDWEGGPRAVLVRDAIPPGGEGPEAFAVRTLAALATIDGQSPMLVVAHSGTARVLNAHLGAVPFRRLGNAELVEWRKEDRRWRCHTIFVSDR